VIRLIIMCTYVGRSATAQLDAILPVYEEVYAEPPYREGPREVGDFLDRFDQQTRQPGFRLVTATSGHAVIGFAFGYLLSPDTQWWSGLRQSLPSAVTVETGRRTFTIIELAVRAPFRRRGIGTALHTALLHQLAAERITLAVRPEPEADPARSAYAAWGYYKVAQTEPWHGAPIYDVMIMDLTPP
jgi:ribosomal protein S18 acetylase RimI-like enzyme